MLAGDSVTVKTALVVPALPSVTLTSPMDSDGSVTPAGTTTTVMLCGGRVSAMLLPDTGTSASWVMTLAAVSCQTWAVGPAANPARSTVVGVLPASTLLMTMTVRAPSPARRAAKAATSSGSGTVAETLVSPKAAPAPL